MKQPEGFEEKSPEWVWRLRKSLYGLKQAGRCWHEKLHEVLTKLGFDRLVCEHSVWVYLRDGVRVIIPVFVDDITIAFKVQGRHPACQGRAARALQAPGPWAHLLAPRGQD